jgi:ribose transport system substrate-binding protein
VKEVTLMNKKLLWAAALAAVLAIALSARPVYLSFHNQLSKEKTVIVMLKSSDIRSDFWQTVSAGAKAAAKQSEVKLDLRGPLSETDTSMQNQLLETAISEKPQAIVLAPTDVVRLTPMMQKIRKSGIQLVLADSPTVGGAMPLISIDQADAGFQAGRTLIDMLSGQPRFAIIGDKRESRVFTEREAGVLKALSSDTLVNYGTFYSSGSEETAYELVKSLLVAHTDLNGFIALSEPATLGAAKAIKELDKFGHVKLIGFENSVYEIQLLEEGLLSATIVQKPFHMGYLAVQTAIKLINGQKTGGPISIKSTVITKLNMSTPENQKLLFPLLE